MANSDKDILITPNKGQSAKPKIEVTGADNSTKTISINDDGTLSFDSTIAATSGSVADGNANLVTGDAVFDYIAAQNFASSGASNFVVGDITGQTALTSGLASTDELVLSDAGALKRMDVSVLQSYMQSNLTFTTDTILTTENVQDIIGAMVDGGTETNIAVTYDDTGGKLNFVSTDTNTQLTQEQVEDFVAGVIVAGSNITKTYDDAAGTLTLAATDTNTQLTTEEVQDIVGAMFTSNTETRVSATYEDGDGTIDLVVDDMTADTNTQLSTEQVQDIVGAMLVGTETRIGVTYDDTNGRINFVVDDMTANTQLTLLDEDNFATNSATAAASQQSIKAYVDSEVAGLVDSSPSALNTLNELAAALGDDASFSTTTATSLGNRLRVDVSNQGLTSTQQGNALTNLGITASLAEINILDDGLAASDIPNLASSKITSGTFADARIAESNITQHLAAGTGLSLSGKTFSANLSASDIPNLAASKITSGTFATARIADDAITSAKIADDAIITALIADDQITNALMADDAIDSAQLADASIDEVHLNATNSPTDNYLLSYDSASGGFTWVVSPSGGGDVRTVTAGGNTLDASETLAFTAGNNIAISEGGGAVTISSVAGNVQLANSIVLSGATSNNLRVTTATAASSGVTLSFVGSDGNSIGNLTVPSGNGTISTSDTQLTTEAVQDIVGGMFGSNTETRISATYQDGDGTIDLVVDDMTANDNTQLSTEQVQDIVGGMFSSNTETNTTVTYQDGDGTIDVAALGYAYTATSGSEQFLISDESDAALLKVVQTGTGSSFEVHDAGSDSTIFQVGSGGATSVGLGAGSGTGSDIFFAQGRASAQIWTSSTDGSASAPAFTRRTDLNTGMFFPTGDTLAFATGGTERLRLSSSGMQLNSAYTFPTSDGSANQVLVTDGSGTLSFAAQTDTNTQLSTEQVQDIVGAMFGSNTETRISATYQDGDGTIDLVVDDMTANTNTQLSTEQVQDIVGGMLVGTETRIGVSYDDTNGRINFVVDDMTANTQLTLLDQDNMSSNSATAAASQQSIKAYVDAEVAGIVDSAPSALNTLNELAAALGDDASFSTTTATSLGNRLRVDVSNQGLNSTQQGNALTNLGITASLAEINILDDGLAASDIPNLATSKITSGTFADARIAQSNVTQHLAVGSGGGIGLSGKTFSLDIDGMTDINAALVDADLMIVDDGAGGTNRKATMSRLKTYMQNNLTFTSNTNTQLSNENVMDIAGPLVATGGTKTRIAVTYDDANNNMDFVVDDMNFSVSDITGATALTSGLAATDELVLSDAGTLKRMDVSVLQDYMQGSLTFTTNTNTQLSTEAVQDIVGAMFSSNTETNITATYQDGDGTIDLVGSQMTFILEDDDGTEVSISNAEEIKFYSSDTSIDINYIDISPGSDADPFDLSFKTLHAPYLRTSDDRDFAPEDLANTIREISGRFSTKTGLEDGSTTNAGDYVDALVLDTFTGHTGGDANLLAFAKNSTKRIYHYRADQDDTNWGTASTIAYTSDVPTTEAIQDIVGAMFSSNTETRVSATYQDGDGTIDLVVDDMTANDNTQLSTEQVQDIVGAMFSSNTETNITATYQDSDGTIDLVASGGGSGIASVAADTTPQLGGTLDVNGQKISSASNADVTIEPNGTGNVNLYADTVIAGDASTDFSLQHRTKTNSAMKFLNNGNNQFIADANIYLNADEAGNGSSLIRLNAITTQLGKSNSDVTLTTQGTGDLALSTNGGTNSGTIVIEDGANNDIVITPNGTGNVGIGIADPINLLHIKADNSNTSQSNGNAASITIEQDGTGDAALNFLLSSVQRWMVGIDNSDSDKFKIETGATALGSGAAMTITTDGDVGIGTTSPSYSLHVVDEDSRIIAEDGSSGIQGGIKVGDNAGNVGTFTNSNFNIVSNDTVRIGITSGGGITFNQAYTFPTSDGSNGQVLQTNGSGTLSFATVSGGGSDTNTFVIVGEESDAHIANTAAVGGANGFQMSFGNGARNTTNSSSGTDFGVALPVDCTLSRIDVAFGNQGSETNSNNQTFTVFKNLASTTTTMSFNASGTGGNAFVKSFASLSGNGLSYSAGDTFNLRTTGMAAYTNTEVGPARMTAYFTVA